MPADNLNFIDLWDIERFRKKCADQRKIAQKWPAYDRDMAQVEEYRWRLGPWSCLFLLEIWKNPPVWHGSAAVVEQVAWQTFHMGREASIQAFGTDLSHQPIEIPQDALLATKSWVSEHYEQARFILAEVFGPILRPGDKHQQAMETVGLMAMHWHVPYEGVKFWLKHQH